MDDQHNVEEFTSTTLKRLKAKWSSGGDQPAIRPPQSGEDSLANTRICQVCQGSGLQTEVYEYRRMEHTCTHCRGEGLLSLGGKQHPSTAVPIRNSKPQQQQHGSRSSVKQHSSNDTVRPSPAWLQKLQQKVEILSQEEADLQADLDAPGSEEQQRLQAQLLQQLQDHLQQLKAKHTLALSGSSCCSS